MKTLLYHSALSMYEMHQENENKLLSLEVEYWVAMEYPRKNMFVIE